MSSMSRTPPHRVPTLTEVVEFVDLTEPARDWERTQRVVGPFASASSLAVPEASRAAAPAFAANETPAPEDAGIVDRVLVELQQRLGPMLEQRLRESLTPALARLTESLMTEVRIELASALRDLVVSAVADESARLHACRTGAVNDSTS